MTVAETRLSSVDGEAGDLVVAGFPVEDLAAEATFEECLFLLVADRLPTADELAAFRADPAARRAIGENTRAVLRAAAQAGLLPMDAVRMGVATASHDPGGESGPGTEPALPPALMTPADAADPADRAAARRVVAVPPTVVATCWRYRQGKSPVAPREDLRHAENALFELTGEEPRTRPRDAPEHRRRPRAQRSLVRRTRRRLDRVRPRVGGDGRRRRGQGAAPRWRARPRPGYAPVRPRVR